MCIRDRCLGLVRCTADFIKILEVSEFSIGLYCGWEKYANHNTDFYKSTVDSKNLKFGNMITWVNTIVPKKKKLLP